MGDKATCPTCGDGQLVAHDCTNDECRWAFCTNPSCGYWGIPEIPEKWVEPLGTYRKDGA